MKHKKAYFCHKLFKMLKTGLAGVLDGPVHESIFIHPGFQITGHFIPEALEYGHENTPETNIPLLPEKTILEKNDVLIFGFAGSGMMEILTEAFRHSRHIFLMDIWQFTPGDIGRLIKLHEEAQTVVRTRQIERFNPALLACLQMITHPCLLEIRLSVPDSEVHNGKNVTGTLLRMLDALLFLSPLNIKKIQSVRHPVSFSSTCHISARIEFDNGSVANLLSAGMTQKESFTIEIFQKRRYLKIDLSGQEVKALQRSGDNGKIIQKILKFKETKEQLLRNELERFYQSVITHNTSGKDLYEIFRLTDLSRKITEKAGLPEAL